MADHKQASEAADTLLDINFLLGCYKQDKILCAILDMSLVDMLKYAATRVPMASSKPAEQQGKLDMFKMSLPEGATEPVANGKRMMHQEAYIDVGQAKCQGNVTKGPKARRVKTGQILSFKAAEYGWLSGLAPPELAERGTWTHRHLSLPLLSGGLQVFKQVEAAAWTKQRLEATEIPGSVLDNNRQASRLNKAIQATDHAYQFA
ncbi:MAG: hypothetical protein FRX49_08561 [Trebouxia sp. A1-2]|nr:MAG: hypothetical protein FRX49_08561 [Trebouxia sp. A1-2]